MLDWLRRGLFVSVGVWRSEDADDYRSLFRLRDCRDVLVLLLPAVDVAPNPLEVAGTVALSAYRATTASHRAY